MSQVSSQINRIFCTCGASFSQAQLQKAVDHVLEKHLEKRDTTVAHKRMRVRIMLYSTGEADKRLSERIENVV